MGALGGFIKEIDACIAKELAKIGFRKRKSVYILVIDDYCNGWLGLNRATYRAEENVEIHPNIGVFHVGIAELLTDLTKRDYISIPPATACTPLYTIMPVNEYYSWQFHLGDPIVATVADLVSNVTTFGLPWIRQSSSPEHLLRLLKEDLLEHRIYRYPALLFLLGRKEEAVAFVEQQLDLLKNSRPRYVHDYAMFAEKLRRK